MNGYPHRNGPQKRLWPDGGVIRVAWEYSPRLDKEWLHGIAYNRDAKGWRIVTYWKNGAWCGWAHDNRTFRTTRAARQRLLRRLQKEYTDGYEAQQGYHLCLCREDDFEAVASPKRIPCLYADDVCPWVASRPANCARVVDVKETAATELGNHAENDSR